MLGVLVIFSILQNTVTVTLKVWQLVCRSVHKVPVKDAMWKPTKSFKVV